MPETQASPGRTPPPDVLERIVESKRAEIRALTGRSRALWSRARSAPPAGDFAGALRKGGEVALIAEVKRRSPGAGPIRPDLDPPGLAAAYARAGAAAVSVLTDGPWFGGSLDDLGAVRKAVEVPLLRKDFTLVPDQVAEARAAGADAVLLIVRILSDERLGELAGAARELGLAALVEVHDGEELSRALDAGAAIVGVNNRDLTTFSTDLGTTLGLLEDLPDEVVVVSESGIRAPADVERLGAAGVDAVLVGESLLRSPDPGAAAGDMTGCRRAARTRGTAE
ncbi:MAG TPA: indole-3-glycerol phosphate synthase TrpC [Longimicrobiales bacterium]|nr:indole-3-glycerol phosphate synthase TrpC [Longimicrobiales bacterium]